MRNNRIFCVSRLCWRSNISNEGHFTIYTSAHSCGVNYNLDDKTQGCFCFAVWFINHVHYTTHIFWSCKLGAKQYFEHNLSFWLFCLFFLNQHMGTCPICINTESVCVCTNLVCYPDSHSYNLGTEQCVQLRPLIHKNIASCAILAPTALRVTSPFSASPSWPVTTQRAWRIHTTHRV